MKSMTGFARLTSVTSLGELTLEIKSLNRKYLDLNFKAPKEMNFLEVDVKKIISKEISRGGIFLEIYIEKKEEAYIEELSSKLSELKKRWEVIAKKTKIPISEITLPFLLSFAKDFSSRKEQVEGKTFQKEFFEALQKIIKKLNHVREIEGDILLASIQKSTEKIDLWREKLKSKSKSFVPLFEKKLKEKLKGVFQEMNELMQQRLLQEVTLFADRSDISEELTRLESHISQLRALFKQKEPSGRVLDFLTQELFREVNTIGVKLQDIELSKETVKIKAEIEKIREQAQNIE